MNWWLSQSSRATAEKVEIANLAEQSNWLGNIAWRLDNELHLVVDFEINHLGNTIPLFMLYPNFFPDVPPLVKPKEEVRLSSHQYGPGGELCLEHRPDNWEPHKTGAMMIESAYRLLTGENPAEGENARVESAHRSTLSQEVRHEIYRVILSPDFILAIKSIDVSTVSALRIEEVLHAQNLIAVPKRIGSIDAPIWSEGPTIKTFLGYDGFLLCIPDSLGPLEETYNYLTYSAKALGDKEVESKLNSSEKELFFLMRFKDEMKLLSIPAGSGERSVTTYTNIFLPKVVSRLPDNYLNLNEKSVAIVGCGSMGSKIAVSLARTGISKFVLVDGDLFFPGNIVRNELDARAIGTNKPNALEARILEINPSADVRKWRMHLGGQESSTSTDAALTYIAKCDLIVDATANPEVFNFTASAARANKKPLIWGEIYGGGIGGLIARSRPDLDPPPHAARRQINKWCEDQNKPWIDGQVDNYDITPDNAPPMIADDADVTVISAHMTRFAIDLLTNNESKFPYSAYAIGLKEKWIFSAPFDTYPIGLTIEGSWARDVDDDPALITALLASLFPSDKNDEPAS